jgi:hypothetical protein
MATPTNELIDADELLVRCGYTKATACYIRSTKATWTGDRIIGRDEAIARLRALLESKHRSRIIRLKACKVLEELEAVHGSRTAVESSSETLSDILASVLGVSPGSLRMSPDNLPSLIDTVAIITGRNARGSADCARSILSKYFPESENGQVTMKVQYLVVEGCGQRPTPFPRTLEALVEFVLLIPGRKAAALRQKAASLIVRYYGGDERMIDEILEQRRAQVRMAEEEPENTLRVFGEAVEEAPTNATTSISSSSGSAELTSTWHTPPPFRRTAVEVQGHNGRGPLRHGAGAKDGPSWGSPALQDREEPGGGGPAT